MALFYALTGREGSAVLAVGAARFGRAVTTAWTRRATTASERVPWRPSRSALPGTAQEGRRGGEDRDSVARLRGHATAAVVEGMAMMNRVGPYELVAPIGAGGMGEIYKAR
jgi:hypothetical protein